MSMNRPEVVIADMSNQSLLLGYVMATGLNKTPYFNEMRTRLGRWGVSLPATQTPRSVIVDMFGRQMHVRDSNANDVFIPEDRKERGDNYEDGVDWFLGEDEHEDLFKI